MAAEKPAAYEDVLRDSARPSRLLSRCALALAWLPLVLGCHYHGVISPLALDTIGCRVTPSLDREELIERSRRVRHAARWAERSGYSDCVDRFYEAAVFAHAAMNARSPFASIAPDDPAVALYNENLADCLLNAGIYDRLDPRSRLLINGPGGSMVVRVVHHGFVWSPCDFGSLVDPRCVDRNPSQQECHVRRGLGAAQVAVRPNPNQTQQDRFLPPESYFSATAILRPDHGAWLGRPRRPGSEDLLEFHDPLRVSCVQMAGQPAPITSDLDSPLAMGERSLSSKRYTLTGFINPSVELNDAGLGWLEPYQPGKVPIVMIHGLLDNPYVFTDMVNDLRSQPGFLDHFQITAFRYPTGSSFLRSAALLRKELRMAEATFDPQHVDPGMQNTVLVAYSMGGLLAKLQVTRSGDAIWGLASDRTINSLVTPESTKSFLRDIFYFEPVPFVRRVVFMATPHEGSVLATRLIGRLATSLVQRPVDTQQIIAQIQRDNPGAIKPLMQRLPSSVDLMAQNSPLLVAMSQLPINPSTTCHVIAGMGYLPPELATGDGVVSLESAHVDGAASEIWVRAIHTNIYRQPATTAEVERILGEHRPEFGLAVMASRLGPDRFNGPTPAIAGATSVEPNGRPH